MSDLLATIASYIPPPLLRTVLDEPRAPTQPAAQGFPAAVLIVDVSGFTPLAEALAQIGPEGPEELTRLLNGYFSRMIDLLSSQGGEVVKFSGDALTVVFPGHEEPLGHAARRAWQAAQAMQEAMAEFNLLGTSLGAITLEMRIGIGAGSVLAMQVGGVYGRWEYVIAGDPVRQAAEAELRAAPGEIVLSPEAEGLVCPHALPPRPLQLPDWSALPDPTAVEAILRCYVPGPAQPWLGEGLRDWLGVLRPMSVLFVGIGGLDYARAEAVGKLHNLLRATQDIAYRYEGTLRQLVVDDKGTVLIVLFGAPPFAHEDDAGRAVRCAVDLVRSAEALPLQLTVGIASGRVFAGPVGSATRREYAVVGDAVNLAARLMGRAEQGGILCDFDTYRQARSRVGFESLPPIRVKGKAGPVRVYGPLDDPSADQRSADDAQSALIGRRAELARLGDALDAVERGSSRVLILTGEAGIGKSRLLLELARLLRERGLPWLAGAGQSIGQQTPYQAWREVFSYYFDLGEASGPAERGERVRYLGQEVVPEQIPRLPLLNDLLGLDLAETPTTASLDPALRQQSLFLLLLALLRAWARERPLILILEDVHWLDSLSWELAEYLARGLIASGDPLLLILATRPLEEGSTGASHVASLSTLPQAEVLTLDTLSPEETVALATMRLGLPEGQLPEEIADLVRRRAEGHPFFAEELVLTLRDEEVIVLEPDPGAADKRSPPFRCVVRRELSQAEQTLPDTIQGLVLARIDRLPPERQLTLKVAAVIGLTFGYNPLRHALERHTNIDESGLRTHLAALTALELTLLDDPLPDPLYSFKHLIIQEVTYGTLLFAQRRQLHRTVAEWYEETFLAEGAAGMQHTASPPPQPLSPHLSSYLPLLVHHYHHAGDTDRERHYAGLAGERAAAQFANAEALAYLGRALELTPPGDHAGRYALLLARESVYDRQGARENQHQDVAALQELAEAMADDCRRAEAALRRARLAEATGDYLTATTAVEEAIRLAQAGRDNVLEAAGYLHWGRVLWRQGEHETARLRMEEALYLVRAARSPAQGGAEPGAAALPGASRCEAASAQAVEADCLRNLGNVSLYLGEYDLAHDHYEQALQLCRDRGDLPGESALLNNLGTVLANQGDYGQAQAYYEQTLRIKQEIGDRQSQGLVLNNLGSTATNLGYYSRARSYFEQALKIYHEVGHLRGEGTTLNNLGVVAMGQGDYDQSRDYLQRALLLRHRIGDRQGECHTLNNLGIVAINLGDYAHARDHLEQSLQICRAIGNRRGEGEGLAYLGLLSHYLGNNAAARAHCEQALQTAQDLGAHHLRGYALTFLGHVLVDLGHVSEAERSYRRALDIRRASGQRNLSIGPLAGLAQVALARGKPERAQGCVDDILDYLTTSPLDGIDEPFRVYQACVQVLRANRDPRAGEVLLTAYHLLQGQAARISDDKLRRSFLEVVAAHREIAQAFSEAGPDLPQRGPPASS